MTLQSATFCIDALGDRFFHGYSTGEAWNGFACPLFPFEEALRLSLINNATDFCGQLDYDAAQDAFLFTEIPGEEPVVFAATVVDNRKLYPVGSHGWTWSECDVSDATVRFSATLSRELAEMRRLGMGVPDRALDMATEIAVLQEHMDMGVSDAADLIIQLAQIEPGQDTSPPPASPVPVEGGCRRAVVLPIMALDEYGEPIAPADLQHVPVASREPTDGDDPNVSAWGVYNESPEGVITHLADCPTQEVAEAIARAINQFVPPAPVPKDSFIVTVSPEFVPEDGDAFDAVVSALQHFEIPACVEVRK